MSKFCYVGQSLIGRSDLKRFPEAKQLYCPWYHWSVFVNETVYKVTASMEVIYYKSSEKVFVKNNLILARVLLNETSVVNEQQFLVFMQRYDVIQRTDSFIRIVFAKEFAETFFGIFLETKTNKYLEISAFLVSFVRAAIPIVVNVFITAIVVVIEAIVVVIAVVIALLAVAYVLQVYGRLGYERPHIEVSRVVRYVVG
jgi:VIT1/CCC1 family predicted Fe2+/Mn2+ transporter